MITMSQIGRYGRFANALYQIAGVIGIAVKSGQPFGFPKFINHDHKERFGSSEEIECYKFFENELPPVVDVPYIDRFIQWGYHDVYLPTGNWNLTGHFQSPKYFAHCIDTVRHYLRMKNEYAQNDMCCIHYRAGDYIDDPNAYHPRCTVDYYREAMAKMPEGAEYIVVSDDPLRAHELLSDLGEFKIRIGHDYMEDFKFMKSCKHFIISNSSYSAMAATLAEHPEKIVVAPKKWFGAVAGINGDDIFDKNWIVI